MHTGNNYLESSRDESDQENPKSERLIILKLVTYLRIKTVDFAQQNQKSGFVTNVKDQTEEMAFILSAITLNSLNQHREKIWLGCKFYSAASLTSEEPPSD